MKSEYLESPALPRSLVTKRVREGMLVGSILLLGPISVFVVVLTLGAVALAAPYVIFLAGLIRWIRRVRSGRSIGARHLDTPLSEVVATIYLTEAKGMCPLGQHLKVGQRFVIGKDGRVRPNLCPLPCSRLQSWAVGQGNPNTDTKRSLVCRDADHRIVFEFCAQPKELKLGAE